MQPENEPIPQQVEAESSSLSVPDASVTPAVPPFPEPSETRFLKWMLFGSQGVRVGWMVTLFLVLTFIILIIESFIFRAILHGLLKTKLDPNSAESFLVSEFLQVMALLGAAAVCALIERRRVADYNLSGPRRIRHFFAGVLGGFVALSLLVGALYEGHWLHVGTVSLSGAAIFQFGILWGIAFLGTGLNEEGMFRCYMLFTLSRGINFWAALGVVASFCGLALMNPHSNGAGGVYLMASLGVVPCLLLHLKKSPSAGFWEAAWLTSTLFGYIHTFNDGETWIGIFSAAAIGFVFCVSIRLTGSAWWAIGFHASWDWAQTFFYGTADSGFQPKGHYLTTTPMGAPLWSGGSDGPEGSLLILPTVLLVLLALVLIYGRKQAQSQPDPAAPQLAA